MIKTLLLTGASGFIGSNIIDALAADYRIIAPIRSESLKKLTVSNRSAKGLKIVQGDFYDDSLFTSLSEEKIDAILHFAAIRGETGDPEQVYRNLNVEATEKLLDFAHKHHINRFLYCSTVGVLGTIPDRQPAQIDDEPQPDSFYHQSKWQAEKIVKKYQQNGFNIIILRPTITYGQNDDGFIPKLISLVAKKRFFYPRKKVNIHLLSVDALAELIKNILRNDLFDGQAYFVADKNPVELQLLVDRINIKLNGDTYPSYKQIPWFIFQQMIRLLDIAGQKGLRTSVQLISQSWTYDIGRTCQNLGYQPVDTMEEIDRILSVYR
jgi:nucleoside-diphosphate-sugar epimerase